VGKVSDCFSLFSSECICFKVHFFVIKPCQELVWFHCMFEVVKCTIAVDLASESNPIVLCFSVVFPITIEELFECCFGDWKLIFSNNQCTFAIQCGYSKTRVKLCHCQ